MNSLGNIVSILSKIAGNLFDLVAEIGSFGANWILLVLWIVWWLVAVDWRKLGPVLRRGGWAPLVMLAVIAALVWSRIEPGSCPCGVPSFWWQLGEVAGLLVSALACGWFQGLFQWAPAEISLDPPAAPHGHHGHGHH